MKWKVFLITFQGLSVAKNCLRPETAPLTILAFKRDFFCNFTKTLKGGLWNFQLLLICKSSKLSSHNLKNMSNIPIGPKQKMLFFQILSYIQMVAILVSQGLTS